MAESVPRSIPGLAQVLAPHFRLGAAVSGRTLVTHAELLRRHFSSLTPENELKWQPVEPEPGVFRFDAADRMAAFAAANGMWMRGHTLVWHGQTPAWAHSGSRAEVLARLGDHIQAVVGRYRGRIHSWDVVNEAVPDRGEDLLRPSPWLQAVGEDYLAEAYHLAHRADPEAQLFYNDYNETDPGKRGRIHRLVADLKSVGVPVHGIGLQGHWRLETPTADDIRATFELYGALGLRLQVTELDISLHAPGAPAGDQPDPERLDRQGARYAEIFGIFREYRALLDSVTLWGVADDATWLDNFPVRGRKDWPLLFDVSHAPKPAFWAVAALGSGPAAQG